MNKNKARKLLWDTINFYTEDTSRRALRTTRSSISLCEYLTEDGRRCAIGRLLTEKELAYLKSRDGQGFAIDTLRANNLDMKKLPTVRRLAKSVGFLFLKALQRFHDANPNWDSMGLTGEGWRMVQNLTNTFHLATGRS